MVIGADEMAEWIEIHEHGKVEVDETHFNYIVEVVNGKPIAVRKFDASHIYTYAFSTEQIIDEKPTIIFAGTNSMAAWEFLLVKFFTFKNLNRRSNGFASTEEKRSPIISLEMSPSFTLGGLENRICSSTEVGFDGAPMDEMDVLFMGIDSREYINIGGKQIYCHHKYEDGLQKPILCIRSNLLDNTVGVECTYIPQ